MPKRPEKKREPTAPAERRVLPMELRVGDRPADETGDWEIIARPYVGAPLVYRNYLTRL